MSVKRLMRTFFEDTSIRSNSGDESDRHHAQMGNELLAPLESCTPSESPKTLPSVRAVREKEMREWERKKHSFKRCG